MTRKQLWMVILPFLMVILLIQCDIGIVLLILALWTFVDWSRVDREWELRRRSRLRQKKKKSQKKPQKRRK